MERKVVASANLWNQHDRQPPDHNFSRRALKASIMGRSHSIKPLIITRWRVKCLVKVENKVAVNISRY